MKVSCVAMVVILAFATAADAESRARTVRSSRARIVEQPRIESVTHDSAVIRWTANTAGRTAKHYGIVHVGTDPHRLDRTVRSPTRWSKRDAPHVTYRVRLDGLAPQVTYYYTVDAARADRVGIGLRDRVRAFTTPPRR